MLAWSTLASMYTTVCWSPKVTAISRSGWRYCARNPVSLDRMEYSLRTSDPFKELARLHTGAQKERTCRAIVSTGRFREQTLVPIGGDLAYSQRIDADGIVHFDVWRFVATRQ